MDNQGAAGSGGGNQRQSALPSSLIPLMYGPTKLQRASASPARSENTGSSGNPPRTPTPFPSIPPSPSLAFNVRPIDGPPGAPTTPDERPLHTSRFPSGTPEVAKKDRKRAGPSPIPVDSPPESRLGALPLNYETQPPHDYPFGFPPVPRYQHIPYSYYGEDEAGPSTTIQASRERSTSRRTVSGRTLPPLSISTWPGQQAYSPSDEPERPEWAEEQRWHEEQQRQVQSTSELRHASRTQSQSSLPTMSDRTYTSCWEDKTCAQMISSFDFCGYIPAADYSSFRVAGWASRFGTSPTSCIHWKSIRFPNAVIYANCATALSSIFRRLSSCKSAYPPGVSFDATLDSCGRSKRGL